MDENKVIVTQENLDLNPNLVAEEVKVGDEIEAARIVNKKEDAAPEGSASASVTTAATDNAPTDDSAPSNEDGKVDGAIPAATEAPTVERAW
ncbi:MAG TPA: hypothetical protein VGE62_02120 [Candidatus Paceibacterota bacterium]